MVKINEGKMAVISVDMHRGHLDSEVATLPLDADRSETLIKNTEILFKELRSKGIPIIHVVQTVRGSWEMLNNPYFRIKMKEGEASRSGAVNHNFVGSPGTEIIPSLYEEGDYEIRTKKRFSSFYATDLDFLLKSLEIKSVLLTGINTNSCVLCTAFEAHKLDYKVLMAKDCVDSMDGERLHRYALAVFEEAIGWAYSNQEIIESL